MPRLPHRTAPAAARRSAAQRAADAATFPVRAFATLGARDRWGLSSLATERFDYAAREVQGRCLDFGCGPYNRFVDGVLGGHGAGIDVFPYPGLSAEQLVDDPTALPFADGEFDTVTFLASLNHVPERLRDAELAEAFRVLRPGGNVVVTMGNPLAEIAVHKVLAFSDRFLGTDHDVDTQRGMQEGESYFLTDGEIRGRLARAGFVDVRKQRFATQWGLNHLLVAWRPASVAGGRARR